MEELKIKFARCILVLLSVLFCVGCAADVDNSGATGYVRFADSAKLARGITLEEDPMYPVDSLYWAYTAQKVDGLYTEGESGVLGTSDDTGSDGIKAGGYKLRPVKQGPATGLRGAEVGPFATGDWVFKVYGYLNYKVDGGVGKFDGLVYSGETATLNNVSRVVKVASGTTGDPVVFELSTVSGSAIPAKGKLAFGSMFITVPEEMRFFGTTSTVSGSTSSAVDEKIVVKVFDETTLIATSTTPVGSSDIEVGNVLDLNPFVFVSGKDTFDVGLKKLNFYISYYDAFTESLKAVAYDDGGYKYAGSSYAGILDDGYALVGEIKNYEVQFKTGVLTTLSRNLNSAVDGTEGTSGVQAAYIAKILKADKDSGTSDDDYDFYSSFANAVTAYESHNLHPIILLNDLIDGGVIRSSVTVDPNGYLVERIYCFDGSLTLLSESDGTYNFGKGIIVKNFNSYGTTVELDINGFQNNTLESTDPPNLAIDAENDDVWLTGRLPNVTNITAVKNDEAGNKGLHIDNWTEIGSGATSYGIVNVWAGFIDFGTVRLNALNIKSDSGISLRGTVNTYINNMNTLRNGASGSNVSTDTGFLTVTLNDGAATPTTKVLYGVEGMYMTLAPSFLTKTGCALVKYNTKADGSGISFAGNSANELIVGVKPEDRTTKVTDTVLYAQWSTPIDGTISEVYGFNGATYTFFNSSGAVIEYKDADGNPKATPTVADLANAKSYWVEGFTAGVTPVRFKTSTGATF